MENITETAALEERAKYVRTFNDTMIKIWKEQITLLNVIDTGRPKVRKARHWFSRKYYMSVMNIKEFMADSLGRQFQGILSEALDQKKFSRNH